VAKHITVGGLGATVVGTPAQVADEFERWVNEADVDGFNIVSMPPVTLKLPLTVPIGVCYQTTKFH
jgi:alkanesulfonate monooxygenase SsuD/methylene tetrahydromethanopterin reductase-like flavin-dependent oxidoreductase (luciferase family)